MIRYEIRLDNKNIAKTALIYFKPYCKSRKPNWKTKYDMEILAKIEVSKLELYWVDALEDDLRPGISATVCRDLTRLRVKRHDKGR